MTQDRQDLQDPQDPSSIVGTAQDIYDLRLPASVKEPRYGEFVGLRKSTNGRTCTLHEVCGEHVDVPFFPKVDYGSILKYMFVSSILPMK